MTREEVVRAAQDAGLYQPRAMIWKMRTGRTAVKLYFGPDHARREIVLRDGDDLAAIVARAAASKV
ncbi:MAG: hypothetical protein K2X43_01240 [Hyphomonadaceae bacterium]|jgi:hypothetical protein|nr:hypothetical protein [Hyphomonadaceae bacterium]